MPHGVRGRSAHQLFDTIPMRRPASAQVTENCRNRILLPRKSPKLVDPFEYFNENDVPKAWTSKISSLVRENQPRQAISIFKSILVNRQSSNFVTVLSAIKAVGLIGSKDMVFGIHGYAIKVGCVESEVSVVTALVGVYSSFDMGNAWKLFCQTANRDVVLWSAMVSACVSNDLEKLGKGSLFLKKIPPMISYVGVQLLMVMLSMAAERSHSGLDYEGWNWFYAMEETYGIRPNLAHYACMVDMLSRQGNIEEALEFVYKMPIEPDKRIWGAVLAGVQNTRGNTEILELLVKKLNSLDPENTSYLVVLSNLYAEHGRWEEVEKLRNMIDNKSLKKIMGYSTVLS